MQVPFGGGVNVVGVLEHVPLVYTWTAGTLHCAPAGVPQPQAEQVWEPATVPVFAGIASSHALPQSAGGAVPT